MLSRWKKVSSLDFQQWNDFMLVLEWKERAFIEKVNSSCFWWFSAAILVDQNGTQIWRLYTKLYKGAWNVSANNSETVGHKDLRLGQIFYILFFYNISFSWLLPLDGFQFIFFVAWQWKRSIEKPNWTIHSVRALFWTKNSRTFQGPILFSRTPFSTKKSRESMPFLVLPQHEQLYREGLSVFAPLGTWESGLDKISTEIQGLSSTDCNFHGLSKPWIFILKFKDFQGACEPTIQVRRWIVQIGLVFNGMINSILNRNIRIWSNGTQPYWLL